MIRKSLCTFVALAFFSAFADGQVQKGVGKAEQPKDQKEMMPMVKLDGDWTVVYAEKEGKKVEGKDFTNVTIKQNMVTCRHDGKEMSWRLEFGPHHMIRCEEQTGPRSTTDTTKGMHTHHGIYIASQDFFCLALNKGIDKRSFTAPAREIPGERAQPNIQPNLFGADRGPYGSHFVLVLRRGSSGLNPK